ncbi:MAG TPA: hypothetical protein VHB21_08905 [Minicystis sp.]|nr:hypothetical protein [Minicystis sp.]
MSRRLCFVDDAGGALASLGAGVARALGHADALATTTTAPGPPRAEVRAVLEEIGGAPAEVEPLAAVPLEAVEHVRLGRGAAWDVWLYEGEGDLERASAARIARDRIERRLDPRPVPRRT